MKVADLYIRVSTDEQADKGYSQRNQDETLQRYCLLQEIKVGQIIYEDHSAKTFNRPAWQAMLNRLKKQSGTRPNFLLFTKWDRFSRNAGDSYQMIKLLGSYGVEPQAIEQPLDLTIPENKIMLAFYLAAPEVENDRRSLNVFHGMRRAKKEGRWMATAPIGYTNKCRDDGRKFIEINEPIASIIRQSFEEVASGNNSVEQIWKEARRKGLICSKNNFWALLRNPAYCGKIIIPAYKDEPIDVVPAQHEFIVTEDIFEKAQRALNEKRRKKLKITTPSRIPLRGLLKCPKCGKYLTGSASKGCRLHYYYYHCSSACGIRYNADKVNGTLIEELKMHEARDEFKELYKKILREVLENKNGLKQIQKQKSEKLIDEHQTKLSRVRDLFISGDIDADDYRSIKTEINKQITLLNQQLAALIVECKQTEKQLSILEKLMLDLSFLYQKANAKQKRELIKLLFPATLNYSVDGLWYTSKSIAFDLLYIKVEKCCT